MGKISILGNQNPEIGTPQQYSVFKAFEIPAIQSPAFGNHQEVAHWEIYVLESGNWRKTDGNAKTGDSVSFTFNQKSLTRKGIKLVVTKGKDKGELILKTKPAKQPKINKIELLDVNKHKVINPLSYMDILYAKAYCTDMEGETLFFTLWEDDAQGAGHNKINQVNKINTFPVSAKVKKGIAEAKFSMAQYTMASMIANMQVAKGDKNEGRTHEYYVTAEYYGKLEASNNVNINNPSYNAPKAEQKKVPATNQPKTPASTQPKNTPKPPNKKPKPPAPAPKKETYKKPITPKAKTKTPDAKGKIKEVSFVDFAGRPLEHAKYGTTVKVKITAQNMKGRTVKLKVWEDDISNQLIYEHNYILAGDENFINLPLTKAMQDKGDDWKEGTEQELFLEVEYAGQSIDSEVIDVDEMAAPKKLETGKSKAVVKKLPKEKYEKVVGLGEEAVIYVTNEIATPIKVDKNGNLISYPDYGTYNGMSEYKEGNNIYCKKISTSKSAFPTYRAYIYRGKKQGEAVKKLKQDIENNTHENAESTILEVARHSGDQNKNTLTQGGPIPSSPINKMFRIRYKTATNHSGKTSYRYRIVDDIATNFTVVKNIENEVSSGSMSIGSRSSISIDPWKSNSLIGCLGIRGKEGGNHSSYSEEIGDQSASNYKNIYHTLNNYLETIVPELTGVYGRRGYSSDGKIKVAVSKYDKEIKVFVLVDPLPELNDCSCSLKKDGREEFYEEFGYSAINAIKSKSSANKFKGLYMVAQRRQENGFKRKVPNNNPMNIKSSGDLGKKDLYTREVINGKEVYINDGFGNFSTIEKGFEGYLELLQKNWVSAYQALTDDSKTINDFTKGLQEKGKFGAYATDPSYISGIQTIFKGVVSDYKKLLDCKLCKAKDEKAKNEIKKDIELLNKLK